MGNSGMRGHTTAMYLALASRQPTGGAGRLGAASWYSQHRIAPGSVARSFDGADHCGEVGAQDAWWCSFREPVGHGGGRRATSGRGDRMRARHVMRPAPR